MSQSAAQAQAFYQEVANNLKVWTIRDDGGIPAPKGDGGKRAMPFWSTLQRAENIIHHVEAYAGFETVEIDWDVFRDRWLIGLEKDGLNVGVNWSGKRAVGYDVAPSNVKRNIEHYMGS